MHHNFENFIIITAKLVLINYGWHREGRNLLINAYGKSIIIFLYSVFCKINSNVLHLMVKFSNELSID